MDVPIDVPIDYPIGTRFFRRFRVTESRRSHKKNVQKVLLDSSIASVACFCTLLWRNAIVCWTLILKSNVAYIYGQSDTSFPVVSPCLQLKPLLLVVLCIRFTFHVEATDKVSELIEAVKAKGMGVGLALKPGTPVEVRLEIHRTAPIDRTAPTDPYIYITIYLGLVDIFFLGR